MSAADKGTMQGWFREAADAHVVAAIRAERAEMCPPAASAVLPAYRRDRCWSHQVAEHHSLQKPLLLSRHHAEEAQKQPFDRSSPNCAILGTASRVTSRMTSVLKEAMAITGG